MPDLNPHRRRLRFVVALFAATVAGRTAGRTALARLPIEEALCRTMFLVPTVRFQDPAFEPGVRPFSVALVTVGAIHMAIPLSVLAGSVVSAEALSPFGRYKAKRDIRKLRDHVTLCDYRDIPVRLGSDGSLAHRDRMARGESRGGEPRGGGSAWVRCYVGAMFKLLKWLLILVVLVVVLVFVVLPLAANTEAGRKQIATVLGDALHRPVRLGGLKIGLFFTSLRIDDLAVDNPEGFPKTPLIQAGSLTLDVDKKQLLDRKVVGAVSGTGLDLHIVKKGGVTNLDGLGGAAGKAPAPAPAPEPPGGGEKPKPPPEGEAKKPPVDMHVTLRIDDSRLTVEDLDKNEKLVVEGVSLEMVMSNREGAQDADLKIRIRSIDQKELRIHDIELDAKKSGDWLDVPNLRARLAAKGTVQGSARLQVRGGDSWTADLEAKDVQIDREILPVVATMFPFASNAQENVGGSFEGKFALKGQGLTWEAVKPNLAGDGRMAIRGMKLGGGSLLGQLLSAAGIEGGDLSFKDAGAEFRVKEGWLDFNRLSASGDKARYDLAGRVSLDGALELKMDMLPIVKQFGGNFKEAEKYVKEIPVPIEGTVAEPRFRMPDAKALLTEAGKGALEKEAGKLIDKIRPK